MTATSTTRRPSDPTPCCKCGEMAHRSEEAWRHVGPGSFTDDYRAHGHAANPGAWCPTCNAWSAAITQGSWGNHTNCPCGYHSYYSIGD